MHLAAHLKESNISQAGFGDLMLPPVTQGLVGQWCRGVTRITLHYALQIEKVSAGQVSCQDCSDMYVDVAERTAGTDSA